MKFLIIQTAFIGDVILATSLVEKLHQHFPDAQIDFLLRKGNEGLLNGHPVIKNVLIWDKKKSKLKNLFSITSHVRKEKYDRVVNLHRFASSGYITAFSGAKHTVGFNKNPLSFLFSKKIKHVIGNGMHETERNQLLIADITDKKVPRPKLYPTIADTSSIKQYQSAAYFCIAPTSVWFTKQFQKEKWVELCELLPQEKQIYLLGAPSDHAACEWICSNSKNKNVVNLSGKLNFLESAALMKGAEMNYVNDSAPMHIASAMNARTTAVFCSTVPEFGFGPLADDARVIQTKEELECRPCGLHGHRQCPQGHFKCSSTISVQSLIK